MKVKFKPKAPRQFTLTAGNVYRVIGIEADDFRIMDDHGEPVLFPPRLFEVVDDTPGFDWQVEFGEEGEMYAYPPELSPVGFFEDYFDGKNRPRAILQAYLRKVAATDHLRKHPALRRQTKAA